MTNTRVGHGEEPAGILRGADIGGMQQPQRHNPSSMQFGQNEVTKAQKVAVSFILVN